LRVHPGPDLLRSRGPGNACPGSTRRPCAAARRDARGRAPAPAAEPPSDARRNTHPAARSRARRRAPGPSGPGLHTPPPAAHRPCPAAPHPPAPRTPTLPAIYWEQWLGVRGAAVLGGVALALAGIFFFRYSIEHDLIPPWLRVVMATLVGLGALAASERDGMRPDLVRTADAL